MTEVTLSDLAGVKSVEVVPGVHLETKLKIRTQRKLEERFDLPLPRIFPGRAHNPMTGKDEAWQGVDFSRLGNLIPLLLILAQQHNPKLTEEQLEDMIDAQEDEAVLGTKLQEYFQAIAARKSPKNSIPAQSQEATIQGSNEA